jgi:hypothetical protein
MAAGSPKEDERLRALALSRISVAAMPEQMRRSKAASVTALAG